MIERPFLASVVLGIAAASACGCTVESTAPPPVIVRAGSVIIRWSIDGTFDPNQCFQGSADRISVTVTDLGGALIGEFVAPCQDFSTRIDLAPGSYQADAALVGASGVRTTSVLIDPFTVVSGTDLVLDIDFPASSFF